MQVLPTDLPGVLLLEPRVFDNARGFFFEAYNRRAFHKATGVAWSDAADVLYKATDYYAPEHERTLLWNDPALGIRWPLVGTPMLADKDKRGTPLADAEVFA